MLPGALSHPRFNRGPAVDDLVVIAGTETDIRRSLPIQAPILERAFGDGQDRCKFGWRNQIVLGYRHYFAQAAAHGFFAFHRFKPLVTLAERDVAARSQETTSVGDAADVV